MTLGIRNAWLSGLVLLGLLIAAARSEAAEVSWNDPGTVGVGERLSLELVFSDCKPATDPVPIPRIDGLERLGPPSRSTNFSMINFKTRSSTVLGYPVRATHKGKLRIDPFEIETDAGRLQVAALEFNVGEARVGGPGTQAIARTVQTHLTVSREAPYVGEVFDLEARLLLHGSSSAELLGPPTWAPSGIVAEEWSPPEQLGGGNSRGVRFKARAFAPEAGSIELPPFHQELRFSSRRSVFSLFAQRHATDVMVATDPVELEVRPLPSPAPNRFHGAVGQFTLDSKLVPREAVVGEPVTWTLKLGGRGNWPAEIALPARAIPIEIRTIQPHTTRDFEKNNLFKGSISEDLVMIPSKPGHYDLAAVYFDYFDPQQSRYQTLVVQPPTLTIHPAATRAATPGAPVPPATETEPERPGSRPNPPLALLPGRQAPPSLPRDPLPGSSSSRTPLSSEQLLTLATVPWLILLCYWIYLAWCRARITDPHRPQREALERTAAAIEQVHSASGPDAIKSALLDWQHASTHLLGIDRAAPTSRRLRSIRLSGLDPEGGRAWAELWEQAEQMLYAQQQRLKPDWDERARKLLSTVRIPRPNPLRVLLPTNLLPLLVAALIPLCTAWNGRASPLDDYRSGHFEQAAGAWEARVKARPDDWKSRYNLGLALAQQGQNACALAQTTAAFLLHPRPASLQWNLERFAARSDSIDPALAAVLDRKGSALLTHWASVSDWQNAILFGVSLICLGCAWLLRNRHAPRGSIRRHIVGLATAGSGLLVTALAVLALVAYGVLARPDAAMVCADTLLRSIPSAAETLAEQKPLPSGTVVRLDRPFLDWFRVELSNGETGWLRGETLVPFYRSPSS